MGDLRKTMKKHKLDKEQREGSGEVLEMFTIGGESKSELKLGDGALSFCCCVSHGQNSKTYLPHLVYLFPLLINYRGGGLCTSCAR